MTSHSEGSIAQFSTAKLSGFKFYFESEMNQKVLTIMTEKDNQVQMQENSGKITPNQTWYFDEDYGIRSDLTKDLLQTDKSGNLTVDPKTTTQLWRLFEKKIKCDALNNQCITIKEGRRSDSAPVIAGNDSDVEYQQWSLRPISYPN